MLAEPLNRAFDSVLGGCVREIVGHTNIAGQFHVYLTFDDGPEPEFTEPVLELLETQNAKASFFTIAQKAQRSPRLLRAMLAQGHAIGNHSLDHSYSAFFARKETLARWVQLSELTLSDLTGRESIGFRPPAGVRTPKLKKALHEMHLPLVMWNMRFYDAVWGFNQEQAKRAAAKMRPGSIVLLHDVQKKENFKSFLASLRELLVCGQERGVRFTALSRDLCENGYQPTPMP